MPDQFGARSRSLCHLGDCHTHIREPNHRELGQLLMHTAHSMVLKYSDKVQNLQLNVRPHKRCRCQVSLVVRGGRRRDSGMLKTTLQSLVNFAFFQIFTTALKLHSDHLAKSHGALSKARAAGTVGMI
jgi:hypothetical protein